MTLDKTTKRLIAARRPFSVVEIENDPRITKQNGKQSSYNIVGKNGSGVAEFGCDELAATWFCEAANRCADEIYSRRPTTPRTEKEGESDGTNDNSKAREVLNRVHEFLSNLCRDARCDAHCSECIGASDLADDVYDLLHAPATEQEGGAK